MKYKYCVCTSNIANYLIISSNNVSIFTKGDRYEYVYYPGSIYVKILVRENGRTERYDLLHSDFNAYFVDADDYRDSQIEKITEN